MRQAPDIDAIREPNLEARVREVIGNSYRLLADGPDLATWVLAEMWHRESDSPRAWKPTCAVLAMGTDGIRGARACLRIHDFGGVFAQLRRADEMQTLAVAFGLQPGQAERWLRGGPVSQADLRIKIETVNPGVASLLRTTHHLLSNEVHGRAQSLSVYENVDGEFDWPPHADQLDPARVRAAFMTILAVQLSLFGVIHWLVRDWNEFSPALSGRVAAFYGALTSFVVERMDHGEWRAIAPGHAASLLGID